MGKRSSSFPSFKKVLKFTFIILTNFTNNVDISVLRISLQNTLQYSAFCTNIAEFLQKYNFGLSKKTFK
ncbi:hypothetical protein BpHYR1_019645 [Brachionus plicatilis]|uniref:Uncharacterized protein n=1 Tax=Brachionus plicatilis TaxID=10195 RepID=A0A3M7RBC4_BRAPC|nr:hypothetical protein BpHYR1_019645 [Brachionus plicatilis]